MSGAGDGSRITDVDKGYKALVARVFDVGRPVVQAGIFEADGAQPHEGTPKATVADVATWHEFGLGVPERSFLRGYFDENRGRLLEMLRVEAKLVIAGKLSKEEALERFALKVQSEIQSRISVGGFGAYPENALSTIAKKGSSTPLVDTGQLRSSITTRVDQ